MARVLILAKSSREASALADLLGLEIRSYRAVNKAGAIKGVRNADVYITPSFFTRGDRHAILGALRYARVTSYYVDPADFREDEDVVEPQHSEKSENDDTVTDIKQSMADELDDDPEKQAELDGYAEIAAEPEKPKATRRKKCPTCDELIPKEEYGAHLTTHVDATSSYFD